MVGDVDIRKAQLRAELDIMRCLVPLGPIRKLVKFRNLIQRIDHERGAVYSVSASTEPHLPIVDAVHAGIIHRQKDGFEACSLHLLNSVYSREWLGQMYS